MVAFESLKTKEKISWAKSGRGPTSSRSAANTRVVAASTVFGKSTPLSIVEIDQMDSALRIGVCFQSHV